MAQWLRQEPHGHEIEKLYYLETMGSNPSQVKLRVHSLSKPIQKICQVAIPNESGDIIVYNCLYCCSTAPGISLGEKH